MTEEVSTPAEEKSGQNWLSIMVAAVVLLLVAGALFSFFSKSSKATISGTIVYSGIEPGQKANDLVQVHIFQRAQGDRNFQDTGVVVPVENDAAWAWTGAEEGRVYEIRADLQSKQGLITSSNILKTTAPASSQVLDLKVTLADIPDELILKTDVTVSGKIALTGYIPSDATLSVLKKGPSDDSFAVVQSDIAASNGVTWSWKEARFGTQYQFRADLLSDGRVIGKSAVINSTAPNTSSNLAVNSTAQNPEDQAATLSGEVRLKGAVVQNSSIIILQRTPGQAEYTVVQRLPAVDGVKFKWDKARSGSKYELTAALQVNEVNVASGNVLQVTAPATELEVVIDTELSLEAPSNTPRVACGEPDGTGNYNATITYSPVDNSIKYYLQAGTSSASDDIYGKVVKAGNGEITETIYSQPNKNYFTRYAYTYCSDCNNLDQQNWSSFSPTLGYKCP